jgi:probable F420-dependent oxidoreductase
MKIRIGIAFGQWPTANLEPQTIFDLIDECEALDIDSIWLSDRLVSSGFVLEPIAFLSYLAGRLRKMKLGTSTLVLPTRNPIVLAKELATLDFLSEGRLFPAFGLGSDESKDLQAIGVNRKERAARADEMILLIRRLWNEENVNFEGKYYSVKGITITPRPFKKGGLPIWIGGRSQAAMRRTGRLGDGWLVSSVSPTEVEKGIEAIRGYAAEAGRQIPADHYGVLIPFFFASSMEKAHAIAAGSIRPRPDIAATEFSAFGEPQRIRAKIQSYIAAGASKFVMRACGPLAGWREQIEILAREVIQPLQTPSD